MNPAVLTLASYLLGAIPSSYVVGRWGHGVDLRSKGSGNLGATNALRVLGWRSALPVLLFDIAKGWVPVWYFAQIDAPEASAYWALAYGGAAIIGHSFSIWVRFNGGKGVATSTGVFLALAPAALAVSFALFGVVLGLTRLVSLASLVGAAVLPIAVWFMPARVPIELQSGLLWFSVGLTFFVIGAHRANIRRLIRGEEGRIDTEANVGGGSGSKDDPVEYEGGVGL